MIAVKNDFRGGLNYDDSYFNLPPNCYVSALNITRDAVEFNEDNVISNIVGNRSILYTFPAGTNQSIGSAPNNIRNKAVSFVWNSNGNHTIVEYDITNRTSEKIFENLTDSDGVDILGFTQSGKINGAVIYNREEGDLLFFLDGEGRPTFMNLTLFKAGAYTPVTRQIIDVAKIPPPSPPDGVYGNDNTRNSNYLQKKLFRFKYRFVYDDNFKSTYSPISAIPLPVNILNTDYTNVISNNNRITVSMQSGAKNVKAIELAVSIQNNNNIFERFQTVASIDKTTESISDDTSFSYEFYNDSTYAYVADNESLLAFDWVPPFAVSQDMANGQLVYGAIREGYDRTLEPNVEITVNTVAAGGGTSTGSLNGVIQLNNSAVFSIQFSGVPAVGTIVNVFAVNDPAPPDLVATYTTVAGDTSASVAAGLDASAAVIGILTALSGGDTIVFNVLATGYVFSSLSITPPSISANTNSISTWPFWGQRRIGIAYYNEKGVTNGILYDADVTFPGYAENGSQEVLLPYLNVKIFHRPPIWAFSYQICFTKDPTNFLYIETVDVNTTEAANIYFDITNLPLNQRKNPTTAAVVSWTFQDGDRVRLIRRDSDNVVFGTAYDTAVDGIVFNPTINNVVQTDKTFIKIKSSAPFSTVDYSSDFFIVQLYRPSLQEPNNENATFYECGIQFPIIEPGTANRAHGGEVTNQSSDLVTPAEMDIYNGDVYFRVRNEVLGETGVGTFNVQDRNFVDFFISAVSNIDGRPQAIELNARETFFPAMVRYGQPYVPNTNINGLNRFYPGDLQGYEYAYGTIQRLKVRARFMRVFQELRVGVVSIFSNVGVGPNGTSVTVNTTELLNPIQYYQGDFGIGDNKESLASFNVADYFTSNVTGGVYRVSLNGIDPISVIYKMNSWATRNLPSRKGTVKVYGGYDQKLNNYVLALEASEGSEAQTLTFSEGNDTGTDQPSFESFISLLPEGMVTVGTTLCAFKDGQFYTHDSDSYNQFFGTNYESHITTVFNDAILLSKSYQSIEELSNTVWDCPEIISNVNTYGTTSQRTNLVEQEFVKLEGKYASAIKRDQNSNGGKINGNFMKGNWLSVKFRKQNATELVNLNIVQVAYVESPLNRT